MGTFLFAETQTDFSMDSPLHSLCAQSVDTEEASNKSESKLETTKNCFCLLFPHLKHFSA